MGDFYARNIYIRMYMCRVIVRMSIKRVYIALGVKNREGMGGGTKKGGRGRREGNQK